MSLFVTGVAFVGLMLALMAAQVPIAIAMILAAGGGIIAIQGLQPAIFQLGAAPYAMTEYGLSVVPLFVLMAEFAARSGLARELYLAGAAFVGHRRGGLAMGTLLGCAGFSAISGSSMATAATIGGTAIREMDRFGYGGRLSSGTVAAGGTLGILIPPSIMLVLYGILTEQSVGRLFAAGIVPGLLLLTLMIIAVAVWATIQPGIAPRTPRIPVRERLHTVRSLSGVAALFAIVMGGIYTGLFSPTEAAGIGAFGAFMIAVIRRRMTLSILRDSLLSATVTTGMLFLIVIGSSTFSSFLVVAGITSTILDFLQAVNASPLQVLGIVLVTYLVLGCFMEAFGMMLLTVPIFYPLMMQFGYDPIWFGIILVVVIEVGLITPPVGMNLFVVRAVAPEIPFGDILWGVIPFMIAFSACVGFLVAWPELCLWVPNALYG